MLPRLSSDDANSSHNFAFVARVLDLVKPVMVLIPEVSPPDRRVRTSKPYSCAEE